MSEQTTMTVEGVVMRLVGPIDPIGESDTDYKRLNNLKELVGVVNGLLKRVDEVACNKKRQEHSVQQVGKFAHDAMIYKFAQEVS